MKHLQKLTLSVFCIMTLIILVTPSTLSARAFKSPSLGGATGLIATPTGHIGWEDAYMGIDIGYHYVDDDSRNESTQIPKVNVNLFRKLEIGFAYDMQDEGTSEDDEDMLLHGKFQFYSSGASAIAIGGNYQSLQVEGEGYEAYQVYLAASYGGSFFGTATETTVVFGKHFGDEEVVNEDDLDFSMGFDMNLAPSIFQGYVHWISDFSNYSYSKNAYGSNTDYRGAFNTGVRVAVLRDGNMKFNVDALLTDAFDENRGFTLGACFGMSL